MSTESTTSLVDTSTPIEIRWPDGSTETRTFGEAEALGRELEHPGTDADENARIDAVWAAVGRAELAASPCPKWCSEDHGETPDHEHEVNNWESDGFAVYLHKYPPKTGDRIVFLWDNRVNGEGWTIAEAEARANALLEAVALVRASE